MSKTLVTGAAGFIGYHLCRRLVEQGDEVVGLDNLSDYYDVQLKRDRLAQLPSDESFRFQEMDLVDREGMAQLFANESFDVVVHLAAQAGVRYSIENPYSYIDSNLLGFAHVLEGCSRNGVKHLVYASSSSVYGANTKMPFSVHDNVDHPVSLYAATKKSNELMAHAYSHIHRLPTTGLRFFTVYGPWGRPDMALYLFTDAIVHGKPIQVFNNGKMRRDFTYVDDIVEAVHRVMLKVPESNLKKPEAGTDAGTSNAPYQIYNIGNNQPVELEHFISTLEKDLGRQAEKVFLPMQPGDVPATYADVDPLMRDVDFRPHTSIEYGIGKFVNWYRQYHGVD